MLRPAFPLAAAAAAAILLACREQRVERPPQAEFLIAAGDSTFWVRTDDGQIRVRRAPLTLARFDGRFHEVYVTDDDRSFYDAVLVGQRVYRRDIVSDDSVAVFQDRRVPEIARRYAAAHPREIPLAADEDASDDPHTVATSEVEILGDLGPYLSIEHRVDVEIVNGEDSHTVRRGVVDLRNGETVSLAALFGAKEAARVVSAGRRAYHVVIDSVKRGRVRGQPPRRAGQLTAAFRFDPTSFSLDDIDGDPMVAFHIPGRGELGSGLTLALPRIRAAEPDWWREIEPVIPRLAKDSTSEVWAGPRYDVVARYDTAGEYVTLVVRDSAQREWPATRLPVPARRVYRLDALSVDSVARHALARAFDESSLYSGDARTVMLQPPDPPRLVSVSSRATDRQLARRHGRGAARAPIATQ